MSSIVLPAQGAGLRAAARRTLLCYSAVFWGMLGATSCTKSPPAPAEPQAAAPGAEAPQAQGPAADPRWRLGLDELSRELAKTGEIRRERVREVSAAPEPDAATLRKQVAKALRESPEVPSMLLDVDAYAGTVTLTGRVGTLEQLRAALLAALATDGVRLVTSKIVVEPDEGGETSHASDGAGVGSRSGE